MLSFLHTSRVLLGTLTILSVLVLAKSDTDRLTRILDCPVTVIAPDEGMEGLAVVFSANPDNYESYSWSVSSGQILSGQGTSSITVFNLSAGGSCTATVQILHQGCRNSNHATVRVGGFHVDIFARRFDEYDNVTFDDEKARLDNLAIEAQNDPRTTVYLIGYGTCKDEGLMRANRAKNYFVNAREIDPVRVEVVDGGCRSEFLMQLWMVPPGARPPTPVAETEFTPCRVCRKAPVYRTRRRH